MFDPLIAKEALPKKVDSRIHTDFPFTDTSEERGSVSFNAKIDDDATKPR